MDRISLNDGWKLYEAPLCWGKDRLPQVLESRDGALPCSLPCDVRMPLMAAGIVKDPAEADYCRDSLWVEDRSWWFVKDFEWPGGVHDAVELTMDRLDFGADILLNGAHIGRHESVHYPFVKDVREWLRAGRNTLAVRLTCGLENVSDADIAEIGGNVCTEAGNGCPARGDKRRAYLRKPQYAFGWDWCPRAATCGIGSAEIAAHDRVAIRNVMFSTARIGGGSATVRVTVTVDSLLPCATQDADIDVSLCFAGMPAAAATRKDALLLSGRNWIDLAFDVPDAKLWWPNGYGGQPLYDLKVRVSAGGSGAAWGPVRTGIRTLELDTTRLDGENRRFAFLVNGVPVMCKGGNWIPSDSLYARISDGKYERLLEEAREAGFTMLRVWGGGLYETDLFYDLCDSKGILLWHDFMFACSAYPDHREGFRAEVERELDHQTKRLGRRACLAAFCGNNENHWLLHDTNPALGGLIVYGRLEPEAVRRNCPHVPWWPSSPYGGATPNDSAAGGRHLWPDFMMNADMERRITPELYDGVRAKFVAEYGYPGPCRMKSVEQYFGGQPVDRDGEIWNLHNNTFEKHTVAAGIRRHYTDPEGLSPEEYLLYAPAVQALMLGYSLEAFRCLPDCWGALFWMFNDCWGETGWTVVDYYLRRKPSFYAVKRAFAPRKLALRERDGLARVYAFNETAEPLALSIEYGYVSFDGKTKDARTVPVTVPPRGRGEVLAFPAEGHDDRAGVWFARAAGLDTATLRRAPFRELAASPARLTVENARSDGADLVFDIKADGFAHYVHFGFGDDSRLSDEFFDLLPGEVKTVRAYGEAGREVVVKAIY